MARVFVLSGPDVGKSFDVEAGALFGRAPECAVVLRDPSVSRKHARLDLDGGRWTIVDLQSRNGVVAAGSRVANAALEDGEEFQLGEVHLRFRASAATGPIAPRPSAPAHADEIVLEDAPDPVEAPIPARAATPAATRAATPAATPRPDPNLARTMLARPPAGEPTQRNQRILQYQRIPDREGFSASDLGQQPLWIRVGIGLLAAAVFAVVFLLAFKGTSFLKAKTQRPDVAIEGEEPR